MNLQYHGLACNKCHITFSTFTVLQTHTISEGYPASYLKDAGVFFLRGKVDRVWKLNTNLQLLPRLRMCTSIPPLPCESLHGLGLNKHRGQLYCYIITSFKLRTWNFVIWEYNVPGVMFWAEIWHKGTIGPYFSNGIVTMNKYFHLLQTGDIFHFIFVQYLVISLQEIFTMDRAAWYDRVASKVCLIL
jgi:hypothetical protein